MNENKTFNKILTQIKEIHDKKSHDYSSSGSYENFERSAILISWFKEDRDKAFVSLIGTKLARLATLLGSGKTAQNESIEDSFLDLANYCVLWAASRRDSNTSHDKSGLFMGEYLLSCGCRRLRIRQFPNEYQDLYCEGHAKDMGIRR